MSRLTKENMNQCFSLIEQYITGESNTNSKESAILALQQLQKITAGVSPKIFEVIFSCNGRPRANGG